MARLQLRVTFTMFIIRRTRCRFMMLQRVLRSALQQERVVRARYTQRRRYALQQCYAAGRRASTQHVFMRR